MTLTRISRQDSWASLELVKEYRSVYKITDKGEMDNWKKSDDFIDEMEMKSLKSVNDLIDKTAVRCLVIADDFTGANDTGMQLARRGYSTEVLFHMLEVICAGVTNIEEKNIAVVNAEAANTEEKNTEAVNPEAVAADKSLVLDTESRGLNAAEAYEKVRHMVQQMNCDQYTHIVKKVDSTIRGNIAAEVKAVDEWMNSELLIFMPALPALGRTTLNGIHYLNGVRISETELGKDPGSPVVQDNIVEMLQERYEECVRHISIDDLRKQEPDFSVGRVFAVDAETDQQMKRVASAALQTGKKVLFVGTAALMDAILEAEHLEVPALGLIGSISEVTRKQIHYAAERGCSILKLNIFDLIKQAAELTEEKEQKKFGVVEVKKQERVEFAEEKEQKRVEYAEGKEQERVGFAEGKEQERVGFAEGKEQERVGFTEEKKRESSEVEEIENGSELLDTYVEQSVKILETGKDLLVISDASWDRAAYETTMLALQKMGLTSAQAGAYTQNILGEIGQKILERRNVAGVFLAGGDTAMGLFEKLGADGSEIMGEIAMGIPIMRLKGGMQDGLKVVTKAGAFGNPDAITYALRKLKEN